MNKFYSYMDVQRYLINENSKTSLKEKPFKNWSSSFVDIPAVNSFGNPDTTKTLKEKLIENEKILEAIRKEENGNIEEELALENIILKNSYSRFDGLFLKITSYQEKIYAYVKKRLELQNKIGKIEETKNEKVKNEENKEEIPQKTLFNLEEVLDDERKIIKPSKEMSIIRQNLDSLKEKEDSFNTTL